MFKEDIEAHGKTASEGIEGGASIRGNKGAVLLYGNYDVSVLVSCRFGRVQNLC
jgi:hypothetical protein